MRRKLLSNIHFHRMEPCGFAGHEITYYISGTVTAGRRTTREDPAEDPEVEVITVLRVDPFTFKNLSLKPADWPFSADEMESITDLLLMGV